MWAVSNGDEIRTGHQTQHTASQLNNLLGA